MRICDARMKRKTKDSDEKNYKMRSLPMYEARGERACANLSANNISNGRKKKQRKVQGGDDRRQRGRQQPAIKNIRQI